MPMPISPNIQYIVLLCNIDTLYCTIIRQNRGSPTGSSCAGARRGSHAYEKQKCHMSNKPTPESSHGIRQALTVPAIIAAVFLGFHVLPLFWRPNPHVGH